MGYTLEKVSISIVVKKPLHLGLLDKEVNKELDFSLLLHIPRGRIAFIGMTGLAAHRVNGALQSC